MLDTETWTTTPFSRAKSRIFTKEHGTSVIKQMVQWFSGNSGENEKRGIPLKVFPFFEKFPVERPVPLGFPPGKPIFPFNWKALHVSPGCSCLCNKIMPSFYIECVPHYFNFTWIILRHTFLIPLLIYQFYVLVLVFICIICIIPKGNLCNQPQWEWRWILSKWWRHIYWTKHRCRGHYLEHWWSCRFHCHLQSGNQTTCSAINFVPYKKQCTGRQREFPAELTEMVHDTALKFVCFQETDLTNFMTDVIGSKKWCSTFGLNCDSEDVAADETIQPLVKEYKQSIDKEKRREQESPFQP